MTEIYGLFDAADPLDPDRVYTSEAFARLFRAMMRDGIVHNDGAELAVGPTVPAAMSVSVGTGMALIQGRYYINDGDLTLNVEAADPSHPRIDRVVVRLEATPGRTIHAVVKKGTPAPSPVPPGLTRTAETWELSLAQIRVEAGATSIVARKIPDERGNTSLCGVAAPAYVPSSQVEAVGAINMQGKALTGLPAPSGSTDAARKGYVDAEIAGKIGGFGISQIAIDADKNWGGKSITNMKALTLTESSTPGLLMIYPTNSIIWQSSIPRSTSSGSYTELKRVTSSHTGSIRIRLTVSTSSAYSDSGTIGIVVGGRLQAEVHRLANEGVVTKTVDVLVGAGEIISFQGRVSNNRATVTITNIQIMGSLGCVPYSTQTPTITVNVD